MNTPAPSLSPASAGGVSGVEAGQRGGAVIAGAPTTGGLDVDRHGTPRNLAQLVEVAAQPEALAAHVESWLRAQGWNFLRKREFLSDELHRVQPGEFGSMLSWSFGYKPSCNNMHLWTPEVAESHERLVRARIAWLEANPADDLFPELAEQIMERAREELARAQSLYAAAEWVREIESEREEKSETHKDLKKRLDEQMGDVTHQLERVLRREDAEFIGGLYGLWQRMHRRRWRHEVERGGIWPHRLTWLDFGLSRWTGANYFEYAVQAAKSVKEVRRVLSIWHVESRVVVENGIKVVVGDLGEGGVVRVFPC